MTNPAYVLGHSAFELERLARQERLIGPMTRDSLVGVCDSRDSLKAAGAFFFASQERPGEVGFLAPSRPSVSQRPGVGVR